MARVSFDDISRIELDRQLSPSLSAKDAERELLHNEAETARLVGNGLRRMVDERYGKRPRALYDVTAPAEGTALPCIVFIHGGFWQEGSKAGSGFAARAFTDAGWAHVALGYSLAPEVRLEDIVEEMGTALRTLRERADGYGIDPDRLVLVGHSAGAHLAAAAVCGLAGDLPGIRGMVGLSGVYDLAPIAGSYVDAALGLDGEDIDRLSPLLREPAPAELRLVVGADETEAFLRQTTGLADAWADALPGLTVERVPGRDHFDILQELARPRSATFRHILEMGA